jgi:hypothetical protein
MSPKAAQELLDKVIGQIFGYQNPLSLDQFLQKYAFDVRLPQQVVDSTTGETTWSQSTNPTKFITVNNAWARQDWDRPKQPLNSIQDILAAWNTINYTATERQLDSVEVGESDNIHGSQSIYRSQDINNSKNILFSDGLLNCEYIVAGQRSNSATFCARIEDSKESSNSFSVVWSKKVVNCFFIEDCSDMQDCMFCSHVSGKQFCIANMQFDEAEYRKVKDMVVRWILTA